MERGPGHSQGAGTGFEEAERLQGLLCSCIAELLQMQLDFYAEGWCTENRGLQALIKSLHSWGCVGMCVCVYILELLEI